MKDLILIDNIKNPEFSEFTFMVLNRQVFIASPVFGSVLMNRL